MKLDQNNLIIGILLFLLMLIILPSSFGQTVSDLSGTTITPLGSNFPDGSSIDFIRGYHCFAEGKLNQVEYAQVFIENKRVLDFQVYLTGFSWNYPGNIDHHLHSQQIDVWPWYEQAGGPVMETNAGSYCFLKFMQSVTDTDNNDPHDCCISVLIVAHVAHTASGCACNDLESLMCPTACERRLTICGHERICSENKIPMILVGFPRQMEYACISREELQDILKNGADCSLDQEWCHYQCSCPENKYAVIKSGYKHGLCLSEEELKSRHWNCQKVQVNGTYYYYTCQ